MMSQARLWLLLASIMLAMVLVAVACMQQVDAAETGTTSRQTKKKGKETKVVGKPLSPDVIPCNDGGPSCKFLKSCGLAPLNTITARKPSGYIINGQTQIYGEWPAYVRLSIRKTTGEYFSCGGTLVTDQHVLTAAHCVFFKDDASNREYLVRAQDIEVFLGDHDSNFMDRYELVTRASWICWSPKSRNINGLANDWALLTLRKPVKFSDYIQPACLPYELVKRKGPKAVCYLVGTGYIGYNLEEPISPNQVQKMRVEKVSCRMYNINDNDDSRECWSLAGSHRGSACHGDSGGPIMCLKNKRWVLVGAVSFGTFQCRPGWDGTYAFAAARLPRLLTDIKRTCRL